MVVAVFTAVVLLTVATPFARHTGKVLLQTTPNIIKDRLGKSLSEVRSASPKVKSLTAHVATRVVGSAYVLNMFMCNRQLCMRVCSNAVKSTSGPFLRVRCPHIPPSIQSTLSPCGGTLNYRELSPPDEYVGSFFLRVKQDTDEQLVLAKVTSLFSGFVKHLTIQIEKEEAYFQ
jgi:hypothetical protein